MARAAKAGRVRMDVPITVGDTFVLNGRPFNGTGIGSRNVYNGPNLALPLSASGTSARTAR